MGGYACIRPVLMRMDAETAHRAALAALKTGLGPRYCTEHPALRVTAFGKVFENPLGLSAGFDKNAEVLAPLARAGFGFVEAGTVTLRPQAGNPRPRVFRDVENESVINRMGFPGKGLTAFESNLRAFRRKYPAAIVGSNIGINKDSADAVADYLSCLRVLAPLSGYIAVNVSSPNTAGLRDLQAKEQLDRLLGALKSESGACPVLLKVAPDLTPAQQEDIAAVVLAHQVDGLIVSNTTLARPAILAAGLRDQTGGLSGRLLKDQATRMVAAFYRLTGGQVPVVGVGGVSSAADAYEKIRAGATLVQLYTALVFHGPALVGEILAGLDRLLARDGYKDLSAAVGVDADKFM